MQKKSTLRCETSFSDLDVNEQVADDSKCKQNVYCSTPVHLLETVDEK